MNRDRRGLSPHLERHIHEVLNSLEARNWRMCIHKLRASKEDTVEERLQYLRLLQTLTDNLHSRIEFLTKVHTDGQTELVNDWASNMSTLTKQITESRRDLLKTSNHEHDIKVFKSVLEFESAVAKANDQFLGL